MRRGTTNVLACFILVSGIATLSLGQQGSPAKPPQVSPDTGKAKGVGDRILDDTRFFSMDFAKSVRSAPAGKGRAVPAPCPKVVEIEKKYGKPDKVKVETFSVEDGPTIMLAMHHYGDLALGVANEVVMAVMKER